MGPRALSCCPSSTARPAGPAKNRWMHLIPGMAARPSRIALAIWRATWVACPGCCNSHRCASFSGRIETMPRKRGNPLVAATAASTFPVTETNTARSTAPIWISRTGSTTQPESRSGSCNDQITPAGCCFQLSDTPVTSRNVLPRARHEAMLAGPSATMPRPGALARTAAST